MMNTGWICPKCTRVHAPSVLECGPCNVNASPFFPWFAPVEPWPNYWPDTGWRIVPGPTVAPTCPGGAIWVVDPNGTMFSGGLTVSGVDPAMCSPVTLMRISS